MFKFPSSGGSKSVNASVPTTIATTTPKLEELRQYREGIRKSSGKKEYDTIPTISSPYSPFATERQLSPMATPPTLLSSSSPPSSPITADAIAAALFRQMNDKKVYTENWINSIEDSRRKEEERSLPLSSTSVSHLPKTSIPPTMNYVVSNNTNVVCSKKSSNINNEENDRDSQGYDNDEEEEEEEEENNDQLQRGGKEIKDPTVDAINVAANVVNDIASAALNLDQPVRDNYNRARLPRRSKGQVSRFASSARHRRRTPLLFSSGGSGSYDHRTRVRRSRSRGRNNETRTSMSPSSLKKMMTTNGERSAKGQNRFFNGMIGRLYRAVRLPVYLSSNVLLAYYVLNSLGVDPFNVITGYANINFKDTVFSVAVNGVASFIGRSGSFLTSVIYNRWRSVVGSFINDSSKDGGRGRDGDTTKISSSSSPTLTNIDDLIWQSYMKKAIDEPSKMLMMNTASNDIGSGCSNDGLINVIAQRMENENLKSFIDPLSELISSPVRDERVATTPFSSTAASASASSSSSSSLIISEALNRILLNKKNENATAYE